MTYIPQTWVDDDIHAPVTAARMTHIEAGIAGVDEAQATAAATLTAAITAEAATARMNEAAIAAGLTPHPADAAATTNIATRSGLQVIDGKTFTDGLTVLLTAQTSGSQNGPWIQRTGAWTRPTWYTTGGSATGVSVLVTGGTHSPAIWIVTGTTGNVIDTNVVTFAQIAGLNVTVDLTGLLVKANNLSDLTNATTARTNLGLGDAATHAASDFDLANTASTAVGAEASARVSADALALKIANNLSDLSNPSTARSELGLGGAAVLAVGTSTGTVAAGDDPRFTQLPTNLQTANYTLVLADAGHSVEINKSTAATVTVPLNSSVAFPIGTIIEVCQVGPGQVTIAFAGGITPHNTSSYTTRVQWSSLRLRKRGTDEWVVDGDST